MAAVCLFLTPIYFMLSMLSTARANADKLAVVLGVVIGPLVYLYSPDLDLVVAGLAGGTIAYLSGRSR